MSSMHITNGWTELFRGLQLLLAPLCRQASQAVTAKLSSLFQTLEAYAACVALFSVVCMSKGLGACGRERNAAGDMTDSPWPHQEAEGGGGGEGGGGLLGGLTQHGMSLACPSSTDRQQ